jgi:hypothetical protein
MTMAKGFVKFLELLPVLGVVKAQPQRKKYRSLHCRQCKLTIRIQKEKFSALLSVITFIGHKTKALRKNHNLVRFAKKNLTILDNASIALLNVE